MLKENPRPQLPDLIELAEFFRPDLPEKGVIGLQALFILKGKIFYESLTPRELEYCNTYSDPKPHLAGRRAGKLAVARASHLPLNPQNLSRIEILPAQYLYADPLFEASQAPYVVATLDPTSDYRWAISLTHEGDTGIAAAVAVGIPPENPQQIHVGIDCMSCSRLFDVLTNHGQIHLQKVFTDNEIEVADSSDEAFAGCFVGKEAVAKALGTGISPEHEVHWTDIEVLKTSVGQQRIALSGGAQERAKILGISRLQIKTIGTSVKTAVVLTL